MSFSHLKQILFKTPSKMEIFKWMDSDGTMETELCLPWLQMLTSVRSYLRPVATWVYASTTWVPTCAAALRATSRSMAPAVKVRGYITYIPTHTHTSPMTHILYTHTQAHAHTHLF